MRLTAEGDLILYVQILVRMIHRKFAYYYKSDTVNASLHFVNHIYATVAYILYHS